MNDTHDYYQLLHVSPDAPDAIIKASYRALMQALKRHPDLGGDHEDAALLNEAYAVLMDATKRRRYDAQRQASEPSATGPRASDSQATGPRTQMDAAPSDSLARRGPIAASCQYCFLPHSSNIDSAADALCNRCSAPLQPVHQLHGSADGKRAIARYPNRQPVRVGIAWPDAEILCTSLDVSLHGMLLESARPLAAAALIKLSCDLLDATARVVYSRELERGWHCGIEFITLRFKRSRGSFVATQA